MKVVTRASKKQQYSDHVFKEKNEGWKEILKQFPVLLRWSGAGLRSGGEKTMMVFWEWRWWKY